MRQRFVPLRDSEGVYALSYQPRPAFQYEILQLLLKSGQGSDTLNILLTHRYIFFKEIKKNPSMLSDFLLFDFLKTNYCSSEAQSHPARTSPHVAVVDVMTAWLKIGIEHQNNPTAADIGRLHGSFRSFIGEYSPQAATSELRKAFKNLEQAVELSETALSEPREEVDKRGSQAAIMGSMLDVDDFDACDLAAALTEVEWNMFLRLPLCEFLSLRFAKQETSRHLHAMITHFNRVSSIVASSIVNRTSHAMRAEMIAHWILTAEEAFRLSSYSLGLQIVSGLNSTPISRLKRTWSMVPSKTTRIFHEINKILNPNDNYISYRASIMRSTGPAIPVLPLFQKDLTFLEEVIVEQCKQDDGKRQSLIDESSLIPWGQIRVVGEIVGRIYTLQTSGQGYAEHRLTPQVSAMMASYQALPDDQIYQRSISYEPLRNTILASDSVLFSQYESPVPQSITATIRFQFAKEMLPMVKRCLQLKAPYVKSVNLEPTTTPRELRVLLMEKIFLVSHKSDDAFLLKQEMSTWRFVCNDLPMPEDDFIGYPVGEIVFKSIGSKKAKLMKKASSNPLLQHVSLLASQLEETRRTFFDEVQTLQQEVFQMNQTLNKLVQLVYTRLEVYDSDPESNLSDDLL